MARVFITGSSDGLGLMAGRLLAPEGHAVVLHARNKGRAEDAQAALPEAADVVTGDLSALDGMRQVAEQADAAGPFDAVIHNAGVGCKTSCWRTAPGSAGRNCRRARAGLPTLLAVSGWPPLVLAAAGSGR